jgi:hypothetical protein
MRSLCESLWIRNVLVATTTLISSISTLTLMYSLWLHRLMRVSKNSQSWLRVPAEFSSFSVIDHRETHGKFVVHAEYCYSLNDNLYKNTRCYFGQNYFPLNRNEICELRTTVESSAVFVDPNNPSESVVLNSPLSSWITLLMAAALICIASFITLIIVVINGVLPGGSSTIVPASIYVSCSSSFCGL